MLFINRKTNCINEAHLYRNVFCHIWIFYSNSFNPIPAGGGGQFDPPPVVFFT